MIVITMTMDYANFVGLFSATTNQNTNESMTIRKKRRKRRWWRPKAEHSLTIVSAFSVFLLSTFSAASAFNDNKNWKMNGNGFIGGKDLQNHYKDSILEKSHGKLGGTKWATATEEAYDELHDAEILQAVQQSIADWEERRRTRNGSRPLATSLRAKRSPAEKVEVPTDDEENKEPTKVCYEELGCFEEAGYIDLLPNSPEEVNTRYLLYNSRRSRGDTPLLDVSAQNVSSLWEWVGKAFNVSAPTKVIVHGFGSSCSNVWVYEMRSALMSVEDCNIICVDWENGATIPNYVRAAANTRLVGKQVAILLSSLEKYVNLSLRNVHMIGFSLGAHVAGFAGSELKNLSRITGLDPAGPLFESQDRRARLDSMDAQFVDVIHSNGENLILGGLGAWQPMGHVDFYPNGGRMQKGCTNLFVGAVSDMIWSANEVYGRSLCNHRRAYKFFTDSVSPKCQFPAVPCESYDHFIEGKCFPCQNLKECSNMGYYADKFPGRGTLFLLTRDEEPFCANQYMVKVENSLFKDSLDKKSSTFGRIQITLIGDLELNETFTITQKKDEKLIRGESVSRIIVPHPALQNFLKIQITYLAYKGWLSSGEPNWRINKISLTNSYGQILSACKEDLELESGIPVMLQLVAKDCGSNDDISVKPNRTAKPTGYDTNRIHSHESHANQTFDTLFPHTQVVRLGNEILNTNDVNQSSSEWYNSSKANKANSPNRISLLNASKIGIGVTEYLNDPWKQKADFGNHLDNVNYDSGEGRRLAFDTHASRRHTNKSTVPNNITESTTGQLAVVTVTPTATAAFSPVKLDKGGDKQALYEFVTEPQPAQSVRAETEITEPVLKPKVVLSSSGSDSVRSRKSHNAPHRPHYGKSINVTAASSSRRSLNTTASVKSGTAVAEESNEFLDLLQAQPEHNSRALKKSGYSEPETTSTVKNTTSQFFVVQFLPQKLVSFLEQAERYARMAFQPFISSQENKNAVGVAERSRRVRTFNSNRWNSQTPKENHDRYDMETQASEAVAQVVAAPSASAKAISYSFPYAYDMPPRRQYWQEISHYPATGRKYIPLRTDLDVQHRVEVVFPSDPVDAESLQ